MNDVVRWVIAISVIVILVIVFVVSFILYQKTPLPKGCEDMLPSEEKCSSCKDTGCHLNIYAKKNNSEHKKGDK